jgi:hypothetical protein
MTVVVVVMMMMMMMMIDDDETPGSIRRQFLQRINIRRCIQKFPDWPPGTRTTNCTALCH